MTARCIARALLIALATVDVVPALAYYPANAKATGQIFCLIGEGPTAAARYSIGPRTSAPANPARRCAPCNARSQ
jgi:hypothetical protein